MSLLNNLKDSIKKGVENVDLNKISNTISAGAGKLGNALTSISKRNQSSDLMVAEENAISETYESQNELISLNDNDEQEVNVQEPQDKLFDGTLSKEEAKAASAVVFAQTAAIVATQYMNYKTQALAIKKELGEIALRNQNNLAVMEKAYQERKPIIDQILKGLDKQQEQLDLYKDKELTEEEHKTYQFLLIAITKQIDSLVHLYDTIME